MCGRFTRDYTWAQVHEFLSAFSTPMPGADPAPAYNIAPTQTTWGLLREDGEDVWRELRWGLIPSWAKDLKIAYSTINARIETVAEKPSFRDAWKRRRCVIPASGYYEWPGEGAHKRPYFIHPMATPVLMFAALWERWIPHGGAPIESFSIVTMPSAGNIEGLHDRMPLMLPAELLRDWISASAAQATEIALAAPMPELDFHAVARAVGNVRNQGKWLIESIGNDLAESTAGNLRRN